MPTKNPRINITLQDSANNVLLLLAKKEHKSVSSLAEELILEALELREDVMLSDLALLRDKKRVKRVKHADAWK